MITKESAPNGTVVYLNSGSVGLTVDWSLRDDGFATVLWFDGACNRMEAFLPVCLTTDDSQKMESELLADRVRELEKMSGKISLPDITPTVLEEWRISGTGDGSSNFPKAGSSR